MTPVLRSNIDVALKTTNGEMKIRVLVHSAIDLLQAKAYLRGRPKANAIVLERKPEDQPEVV